MICKTLAEARKQAQANATKNRSDWIVFIDTSGNPRAEPRPPVLGTDPPGSEVIWPPAYNPFAGAGIPDPVRNDGRCSIGILYYDTEAKAEKADAHVRKLKLKYNGGFFHGMECGREKERDYTPDEAACKKSLRTPNSRNRILPIWKTK